MTAIHQTTRVAVLERVIAMHVLATLSHIWGRGPVSRFVGDSGTGRYALDGADGNRLWARWNEGCFVAATSEVAAPLGSPREVFVSAPPDVRSLSRQLLRRHSEVNGTFWLVDAGGTRKAHQAGSEDWLAILILPTERAFHGAGILCLKELLGLAEPHLQLAQTFARNHVRGIASVVGPGEERLLLATRPGLDSLPEARDALRAAKMLAQAGVAWADPRAAVTRAVQRIQARRAADDVDGGMALLLAVSRNDRQAVEQLVAGGANLEARARVGWLPGGLPEETPLLVAARCRHTELAELLLAAGAQPNAQTGGYTALALAAERANETLCRSLLRRGASTSWEWRGPVSVLELTEYHQDATVLRLLLDAGAPLPRRALCETLAAMAARYGAADLVPRLLPVP